MYVKRSEDGKSVELNPDLGDKVTGFIFLIGFFGLLFLILSTLANTTVNLVVLGLFLLISFYHWKSGTLNKAHFDQGTKELTVDGITYPIYPDDAIIFRREYRTYLYFVENHVPVLNVNEEIFEGINLRGTMTVPYPVNPELEGGDVIVKNGKRLVRIDATHDRELIEKYRTSSDTQIFGVSMKRTFSRTYLHSSHRPIYTHIFLSRAGGAIERIARPWLKDQFSQISHFAEEIAEICGVTFIDHGGLEPEYKEPGETDVFLGQLVSDRAQGNPREPQHDTSGKIEVETDGSKTILRAKEDEIDWTDMFEGAVGVILLYIGGLWLFRLLEWAVSSDLERVIELSPLVVIAGIIIYLVLRVGYKITNGIKGTDILEFGPAETIQKHKGTILTRTENIFPTKDIESIIVVQRHFDVKLELVSDIARIMLPGKYTLEEANQMKEEIEYLLAKYA